MDYKSVSSKIFVILFFFFALFIYTKLAGSIPFAINSVTTNKSDAFSVTGTGKVSAKPDTAKITVGVTSSGKTVKEAQNLLNSAIDKVSSSIKSLGIDSSDIQTTNYNINPSYDYRTTPQQVTGYSANTNLVIKVKDISKANLVLDSATSNGANNIGGISFEVSQKEKFEQEAREKAVADAKSKASQAAEIAGFSLGKIVNYSENFGGFPPRPIIMSKALTEQEAPTNIETGSSDITVTVTLSFEVR